MSWTKHEVVYQHKDGRETTLYMQTDGNRYVLSEHPDNKGPHVSSVAPLYGDQGVKNSLDVDPKNRPENFQLYAERPDGRFDQWQAKTTMNENISQDPNRFEHKASEWQWRNSTQIEHADLEQKLGARFEQGNLRYQDMSHEQQNKAFQEASLAKTEQSEQLRQAANQQEEAQKQRHER